LGNINLQKTGILRIYINRKNHEVIRLAKEAGKEKTDRLIGAISDGKGNSAGFIETTGDQSQIKSLAPGNYQIKFEGNYNQPIQQSFEIFSGRETILKMEILPGINQNFVVTCPAGIKFGKKVKLTLKNKKGDIVFQREKKLGDIMYISVVEGGTDERKTEFFWVTGLVPGSYNAEAISSNGNRWILDFLIPDYRPPKGILTLKFLKDS